MSKNVSGLALMVWERQCFEEWEDKDQQNNNVGVCRIALATMCHKA